MPTRQGDDEHPLRNLEPLAWQPLHRIGRYAASSGKGHRGGMMRDGGGGKIGG
jgi:hypothetical protein